MTSSPRAIYYTAKKLFLHTNDVTVLIKALLIAHADRNLFLLNKVKLMIKNLSMINKKIILPILIAGWHDIDQFPQEDKLAVAEILLKAGMDPLCIIGGF